MTLKKSMMKKGDIILLPFPFTDLKGNKLRPALILVVNRNDIVVAFITTNERLKQKTDIIIEPKQSNGLKKRSIVLLNKIATLDKALVIGKIGYLTVSELKDVDKSLLMIFDIDSSLLSK